MNASTRFCLAFCLLLGAIGLVPAAAADAQRTALSVGQGWALVNETRHIALRPGVHQVQLVDLPEGIDLPTLVLRHRRLPLDVLSWRRLQSPASSRHPSLYPVGDRIIWMADGPEARPALRERGPVQCTIRSALSGTEPIDITYLLSGLSWQAVYQIAVRGDLANERDPVSVDLVGRIAISNGSDRLFSNAAISLLGIYDQRPPDPRQRAGWLAIPPFTTLAHTWPPVPDVHAGAAPPAYRLAARTDVAPRGITEFTFATARRAPAQRLYRVTPDRLASSRYAALPLNRLVVLDNQPAAGLGFAMPPGEAEIYLGGIGFRLWERGRLPHTAAGQRILIDLGSAERVTVRHIHMGTERLGTGNFEETYEVRLRNELDSPVLAEVHAIPDAVTAWEVTRSSQPFQREGRRLIWTPTLPARGNVTLSYQLRVQPGFDPVRAPDPT